MTSELVSVVSVRVVTKYLLELAFDDGRVGTVDMEPLTWGPAFAALRNDYGLFCQVRVDADAGTIVWPNGADYSPTELHRRTASPSE